MAAALGEYQFGSHNADILFMLHAVAGLLAARF